MILLFDEQSSEKVKSVTPPSYAAAIDARGNEHCKGPCKRVRRLEGSWVRAAMDKYEGSKRTSGAQCRWRALERPHCCWCCSLLVLVLEDEEVCSESYTGVPPPHAQREREREREREASAAAASRRVPIEKEFLLHASQIGPLATGSSVAFQADLSAAPACCLHARC